MEVKSMRTKIIILSVIISLGLLSNAFPQDKPFEGEFRSRYLAWFGCERAAEQNSPSIETLKRMAALWEAKLNLDKDKYFLNFDAGDFGYDTQYYKIDGGMWESIQG
jgi:hypothetical protein